MPVSAVIGLGTLAYGIYSSEHAKSQKKKADAAAQQQLANAPKREISPYALSALADAEGRLNAVDPGVLVAQRQLDQGVANQQGYAQRNAASGAQALAVSSMARSNANLSLPALLAAQAQAGRYNRQAYYAALQNVQGEGDKVFDNQLSRYGDNLNFQLGLVGAASQNQSQGLQLAAQGLGSLANNPYIANQFRRTSPGMGAMGGSPALGVQNPYSNPYQESRGVYDAPMAGLNGTGYRRMGIPGYGYQQPSAIPISPGWYYGG